MGSFRPGFAKGCGIFLDRVEGGRGGGGERKLFGKKEQSALGFFWISLWALYLPFQCNSSFGVCLSYK